MTLTKRRRPRLPDGVRVRRAEPSDLTAWAAAANEFYRDHEFWQPLSAELLGAWLKPDHTGIKRSLYLAEDRNGRMLAGMGSDDYNQLFTWDLENAPRLLRIAGRLFGILHSGRYIRVVRIVVPWYQDANSEVGRGLLQWLRWQLRPGADVITIAYDPSGPMKAAIPRPIYSPSREGCRYVSSGMDIGGERAIVADFL